MFGFAAVVLGSSQPGKAGAFLEPEGHGQIIAGVGYIEASRTFDRSGKPVASPSFRKTEASGYIEYGLTDWLTLVAAPTLARLHEGALSNAYTGSDESAFGARLPVYRSGTRIVSFQVLVEPPLRGRDTAVEAALGGPRTAAVDLRTQYGQSFEVSGRSGFVDIEAGALLRGGGLADEARLDATVGLEIRRNSLVLVQNFVSLAPRTGPLIPRTAYDKLQLSLVQALSRSWSVQVGGVRTLAGRNAARETGPFAALWYRF